MELVYTNTMFELFASVTAVLGGCLTITAFFHTTTCDFGNRNQDQISFTRGEQSNQGSLTERLHVGNSSVQVGWVGTGE